MRIILRETGDVQVWVAAKNLRFRVQDGVFQYRILGDEVWTNLANFQEYRGDMLELKDLAVQAAMQASNSATVAVNAATSANRSAEDANAAKSAAITKASDAQTSANTATTKATEATASATLAGTKATEAAASATLAGTKATEAQASATLAGTKATEAQASATSAQSALSQLGQNGFQGTYDPVTNTPNLSAVPNQNLADGVYYTVLRTGTLAFSTQNYPANTVVNQNDVLRKKGNVWALTLLPQYTKESVQTTQERAFSTTLDSYKIGGLEVVRKDNTLNIVICCSSNGEVTNNWADMLKAYLITKGYNCINVSIGGTNSQSTIDRFYKDVVLFNPDILIENTALWNEGLYGSNQPETIIRNRLNNLAKIKTMCDKRGIVFLHGPVFHYGDGATATDGFVSQVREYIHKINEIMIGSGESGSDGKGVWKPFNAIYNDLIHIDLTGNQEIWNAVNVERITHNFLNKKVVMNKQATGFNFPVLGGLPDIKGLVLNFERPLRSFTIAFKTKVTLSNSICFFQAYTDAGDFRMRRSNTNIIDLVDSGSGLALYTGATSIENMPELEVVVTVNFGKPSAKMFINGVKSETSLRGAYTMINGFKIGNRVSGSNFPMEGCSIRNLILYRSELSDYECINMFKRPLSQASLIFYSDLDEVVPQGGYFTNQACSTATLMKEFA